TQRQDTPLEKPLHLGGAHVQSVQILALQIPAVDLDRRQHLEVEHAADDRRPCAARTGEKEGRQQLPLLFHGARHDRVETGTLKQTIEESHDPFAPLEKTPALTSGVTDSVS